MRRGTMRFGLECYPAFNYARDKHTTRISNGVAYFHAPGLRLGLRSGVALRHSGTGVIGGFSLSEGRGRGFELYEITESRSGAENRISEQESEQAFAETVGCWRDWVSKNTYRGR